MSIILQYIKCLPVTKTLQYTTIHQTKSSLLTINLLRFKPWSVQLNTTVMYSQELKKDYHENLLWIYLIPSPPSGSVFNGSACHCHIDKLIGYLQEKKIKVFGPF